jgi:hypothetical protein
VINNTIIVCFYTVRTVIEKRASIMTKMQFISQYDFALMKLKVDNMAFFNTNFLIRKDLKNKAIFCRF